MKYEQQMFRDQLAVDLVLKLAGKDSVGPEKLVNHAFEIATLTTERIAKDVEARNDDTAKAEQAAFDERRKTCGINVVENEEDFDKFMQALRAIVGRS